MDLWKGESSLSVNRGLPLREQDVALQGVRSGAGGEWSFGSDREPIYCGEEKVKRNVAVRG